MGVEAVRTVSFCKHHFHTADDNQSRTATKSTQAASTFDDTRDSANTRQGYLQNVTIPKLQGACLAQDRNTPACVRSMGQNDTTKYIHPHLHARAGEGTEGGLGARAGGLGLVAAGGAHLDVQGGDAQLLQVATMFVRINTGVSSHKFRGHKKYTFTVP